jgi:hypothetical protein
LLLLTPLCTFYPFVISGVVFLGTLIKGSTSKLVKRYAYTYFASMVVYSAVWALMSIAMLYGERHIVIDKVAELVGSFSGIIINSLRILDPAFLNYIKSRVRRPRRKESLHRNNSVYESSYIQMFTHVFSVAVLKSIISLNLVMGLEDEEHEDSDFSWTREHYEQKRPLRFDAEDIKDLLIPDKISYAGRRYVVQDFKCSATVHAPMVFSHIRSVCGISSDSVSESFDVCANLVSLKANAGNDGGRSASFFYFSHDRRFLIKTISKAEKRFLMKGLLTGYHKHLMNHEDSLLSRIIGVFTFKFGERSKTRVMLQVNIFPKVPMIGIFDLKGSKVDRSIAKSSTGSTEIKPNAIYKDLDFLNTKKKLHVEEIDLQKFKLGMFKDTTFLCDHNIIDYSLLLGISYDYSSEIRPMVGTGKDKGLYFYVGIIDYLQTYTTFKQLEAFSKNLIMLNVPKEDISVISPDQYCDRFVSFLCSIVSY